MIEPTQAVFLSYAREDAPAARRIAEALRAAGVEVWFDENELRGGDEWDAHIKRQIRECALFIPIISAQTQARTEGYFRREWKLADHRTGDMGRRRAFLVPVCIDGTKDADADVPDSFMRAQWTRLPGALPTPAFVAQVKKLLGGQSIEAERSREAGASLDDARAPSDASAQGGGSRQAAPRQTHSRWIAGAIAVVAVGVLTVSILSRKSPPISAPQPQTPEPKSQTPAPAPKRILADKSVAVLPFTNMSEDKDSGYFADGVHEDVLTNLALVRELRVVSRTSVQSYRGTTKTMKQIAQELGVVYILEGSVRRSGNKVRVTGQLIHAATDEHVWAQSYDRDLTDIFAIQAELAQQIAKALSAALSPEERARLEHPTVANPAAYDLLLRARRIDRDGNDTRQELETEEAMLQSAVALDPNYAAAWAALGALHSQIIFNNIDTSAARLAKSQAAIDQARRLDPDNPDVILGVGTLYYYGRRDYPRALEQFARLRQIWPNNYYGHFLTGLVLRRQGKWAESLASLRRAAELDPGSAEIARNLMITFAAMRRYPEAIAEQQRRVRLLPESLRESFEVARLHYFMDGSTKAGDELLAGPVAARADPAVVAGYRKLWASMKGDFATVRELNREFPDAWAPGLASGGGSPAEYAWNNATVLAALGDLAGARARVERFPLELRARLVNEPKNAAVWSQLAHIEALLGHQAEALAAAREAMNALPASVDPLAGRVPRIALAFAQAWTGEKSAACEELRQLLAATGLPNVYWLKTGPQFAPLKGDPTFEALVNDPKNNQPLL